MTNSTGERTRDYGAQRLIVELTNICNLHCSYCLRDEDALYHTPANFFQLELLRRIVREARETAGITELMFTGGEVTLHPRFKEIIEMASEEKLKTSFITNGWHFERVWPTLNAHRDTLTHVAFSLDGATRETHDRWRGDGSFVRLVRAFSRCSMSNFPFIIKVGIRRDTAEHLEEIAMFAARMGAKALNFGHVLPTSGAVEDETALNLEERARAEEEIAALSRIFKMRIQIEVGYYNLDHAAPCSALEGTSCNVDYRGRLSLCCNLSGFRGAGGDADVIGDLKTESFADAYTKLRAIAETQRERRIATLKAHDDNDVEVDLYNGSPCLFCLKTFAKIPWRGEAMHSSRTLPVINTVS